MLPPLRLEDGCRDLIDAQPLHQPPNLKAKAPNATIEANKELVAAAKPRALVRWWEAVPSQIQGDLVAAMGAFMFDPTPEQAAKSMADMQAINADYWANK